jgi:hypothetical protein
MKRILFALVVIVLMCSSCQTSPYIQKVDYLDYSFFKEKIFFITETNTVSFPYESLGSISVIVRSGKAIKSDNEERDSYKPLYQRKGSFKRATLEDAYQLIYDSAREKGANGLLRFNIEYLTVDGDLIKNRPVIGYVITGMAIKK